MIYQQLKDYASSGHYGFHMPGHKRNTNIVKHTFPFDIDITEIEGFDDLHHAKGIIKEAEKRAANVCHAEETHFLINGSTCGILSAILGSTKRGDKILVGRNCHKSVYHAMVLNELVPVYVYPASFQEGELNGPIAPEEVKTRLEKEPEIKAVVLVSPTYDGVVSDLESIAGIAHAHGVPLIVDEAHGAHFGLHPYFPKNANQKGADIVIHSTHKTMPALTQTALLHINGTLVDRESICRYLHMLQSSSPSYVLMASIDACMEWVETEGTEAFEAYSRGLKQLRSELGHLRHLRCLEWEGMDPSKILISCRDTDVSGLELQQILLKSYKLQMEMSTPGYVLAMTSPADTLEGFERLSKALYDIDRELVTNHNNQGAAENPLMQAERVVCPHEMASFQKMYLLYKECEGKVAAEYAYLYPPGIPILVPGERISREVVDLLCKYRKAGFSIEGLKEDGKIGVCING